MLSIEKAPIRLTVRETEVLKLVVEGKSVAEIGDELSLARTTVYSYLRLIACKLGCLSHVYTIRIAYRLVSDMD